MITKIRTASPIGIHADILEITADVSAGTPQLRVVGIPEHEEREHTGRVRAAIRAAGFDLPPRVIVVNVTPDDPLTTNHLDLPSCDVLEDALTAYPGTVLLVTHDRHLIRNVADALIEVRDGQATWHTGVPDEVLTPPDPSKVNSGKGLGHEPAAKKSRPAASPKPGRDDGKRRGGQETSALRKRVNKLEKELEKTEARVSELHRQLADPDIYEQPEEVHRLATEHERMQLRAGELMEQWTAAAEELDHVPAADDVT